MQRPPKITLSFADSFRTQDSAILLLMATFYYTERYGNVGTCQKKTWGQNVKDTQCKLFRVFSCGVTQHELNSSMPELIITCAMLSMKEALLETWKFESPSHRGLVTGSLPSSNPNSRLRRKSQAQHKPHCLNQELGNSQPFLSVYQFENYGNSSESPQMSKAKQIFWGWQS